MEKWTHEAQNKGSNNAVSLPILMFKNDSNVGISR